MALRAAVTVELPHGACAAVPRADRNQIPDFPECRLRALRTVRELSYRAPVGAGTGTDAIPSGQGYIYIWPAVATRVPQDSNCNGNPRKVSQTARDVSVQVKYKWSPLMPLVSSIVPSLTITTISVVHTEY